MALVRATQQTALPTVRQLVGDLKKLAREAASAPALDNLVASLDALDAHAGRKSLDVELILAGALTPEDAGVVATWIGPGFHPAKLQIAPGEQPVVEVPGPPLELRVQVRHLTSRLAQKAGAARAPIAVLVAPRPLALSADEKEQIERAFDDRPQIVLLACTRKAPAAPAAPAPAAPAEGAPPAEGAVTADTAPAVPAAAAPDAPADGAPAPDAAAAPAGPPSPADEPWFKEVEAKAKAAGWSSLSHKYVPDTTLQTRLGSAPWDQLHDLFRAHGVVVGLDALSSVYDMVLEQVQDEMRVNKSVGQQKLAKLGGAKGGAAPASPTVDLLAELKTRTQRLAAEFERGASDRLQDLLGQPAGLLVRETEQALGSLQELQLEKKSKTMGARVPAAFEEKINKLIRERVGRHCAGDLVALNDLFRLIGQEFERTLAQAQGPPIVVQFRYLTDERVRRMLDMYGIFQSPYKGEMPNPGFGEYFASVRKYSMVLVMGASMFGMSAMLRQYREITVPITVLLVAFGTYSVATATRQQRVENLETQLEAARVGMRTEIRRIITDLQKQWTGMLKEFLNDQISGAVAEVDAALKESQGKKAGGEANPERDRVTRQLATIEAAEKRIGASGKARETFVQGVAQIRGDLKGLMAGGGPPGMARPGMPGAAGAARPGMPAVPARPGMPGAAGARPAGGAPANPALAEARAKMEAMKNKSAAAGPAAAPAGGGAAADFRARMAASKAKPEPEAAAAPAAPAEPKVSAADAFKAKMAAMKAAKAEGAPAAAAAPAAPPAAAAPAPASTPAAAEAPAAAAEPAAAAAPEPKVSAADAFKAKMAAMKAAKAAPAAAAAEPAAAPAAAAPAPPTAPAPEPAAEAPAAAAPAGEAAAPAPEPAPAAPGEAAAPAGEAKVSAADAFKAKMAAMKAAKAGAAAAPAPEAAAAPTAEAPAATPVVEPAAPEAAAVPPAAAPAAEAKVSAADAFKAKMAAMKAAKTAPAAVAEAAPAAAPAPAADAKVSAADAFKAKMAAMKAAKAGAGAAPAAAPAPPAAEAPAAEAPAVAAPEPPAAPPPPSVPAEEETHFAETMEIRAMPEVKSPERAE